MRTYANVTGGPDGSEVPPEVMDDEEAELAASASIVPKVAVVEKALEKEAGNTPNNAPLNTEGVAGTEDGEAGREKDDDGNTPVVTHQGRDFTEKPEEAKDDDDQDKARPPTSAASQQSDGTQPAASESEDANTAQATAAAKRRRDSPGLSDEHRLKQLEREWSKLGNKKGKGPTQQARSVNAPRFFRP